MPFPLEFDAVAFSAPKPLPRIELASYAPEPKSPKVVIDNLEKVIRATPAPPVGRPEYSLTQIASRDVVEQQWYKLLTHKQRLFVCALFANGFDFAAAAREVVPNLNLVQARAKGKYWYNLPKVRAAVENIFTHYQEATKVRWEDLIGELRTIAFANIMSFYSTDRDGTIDLNLPSDGDPALKAIAEISIEHTRFGPKSRIKMHDKMGAIDRLIKLLQPSAGSIGEGGSIVVQNINIIPVPQGQFLPAPVINQSPIIDVTPTKTSPKLSLVS